MSTFIKTDAIVLAAAILALAALAGVGKALQDSGVVRQSAAVGNTFRAAAILLFLVIGFAAIPLMVHAVIGAQVAFGNGDRAIVRLARESEFKIIAAMWSLIGLGTVVALPAMLLQMSKERAAEAPASQGTLSVNVGVAIDQAIAQSTLRIGRPQRLERDGSLLAGGEAVFDLLIAGTGVRVEGCRAYWVQTGPGGGNVEHVTINATAPTGGAGVADEAGRIRGGLAADGWERGRSRRVSYRPAGAAPADALTDGEYWAKGDTLLVMSSRPVGGDAAQSEEQLVLTVELAPRAGGLASGVVFGPSTDR